MQQKVNMQSMLKATLRGFLRQDKLIVYEILCIYVYIMLLRWDRRGPEINNVFIRAMIKAR